MIVLGGDGTLTSISHNIDDATLVMGATSIRVPVTPDGSVGFYMDSDVTPFDSDLRGGPEGTAIVNWPPRLQAVIETTFRNRFTTVILLNIDLLVANTHQYAPSKYRMTSRESRHPSESERVGCCSQRGSTTRMDEPRRTPGTHMNERARQASRRTG